jgi:AcrR family transcriptional regulator
VAKEHIVDDVRGALSADKTAAIVRAVLDELAEAGFANLTMELVATRAGVGRATIYRRWPSKDEMIRQVLAEVAAQRIDPPDTGSLRKDLWRLLREAQNGFGDRSTAAMMAGLIAEARRSPALDHVLEALLAQWRRTSRLMLRRAQLRGEVASDTDVSRFAHLIVDLLVVDLVLHRNRGGILRDHTVDAVIAAVGAPR